MLVKFEQNLMVQTTRNLELFDKKKQNKTKQNKKQKQKQYKTKNGFIKTIFDKALTPFWKTFL